MTTASKEDLDALFRVRPPVTFTTTGAMTAFVEHLVKRGILAQGVRAALRVKTPKKLAVHLTRANLHAMLKSDHPKSRAARAKFPVRDEVDGKPVDRSLDPVPWVIDLGGGAT